MLYGEFRHQVDAKNRIRIPFRFKDELGEKYVLCKAEIGIISIYSAAVADEKFSFLKNVSPFDRKASAAVAEFLSGFFNCADDGHGRIMIPEALRKDADLGKDVVSIGMGDHIELMSERKREEIAKTAEDGNFMATLNDLFYGRNK